MRCPDESQFERFLDGELPAREFNVLEKHMRTCSFCGAVFEGLIAREELLSEALAPEPDSRALVSQVLSRLRAEGRLRRET